MEEVGSLHQRLETMKDGEAELRERLRRQDATLGALRAQADQSGASARSAQQLAQATARCLEASALGGAAAALALCGWLLGLCAGLPWPGGRGGAPAAKGDRGWSGAGAGAAPAPGALAARHFALGAICITPVFPAMASSDALRALTEAIQNPSREVTAEMSSLKNFIQTYTDKATTMCSDGDTISIDDDAQDKMTAMVDSRVADVQPQINSPFSHPPSPFFLIGFDKCALAALQQTALQFDQNITVNFHRVSTRYSMHCQSKDHCKDFREWALADLPTWFAPRMKETLGREGFESPLKGSSHTMGDMHLSTPNPTSGEASGECAALERLVSQQLQGPTTSTARYEFNFVLHAGFIAVVLVRYDDDFWHVRILLARVEDKRWIIYTPDSDLYEEDYGPNNGDITGARAFKADGSIPASLHGASIYNFRAGAEPDQAALRGLMEEAQDLVALAGRGVAPPGAEPEVRLFAESNAMFSVGDECPGQPEVFVEKRGLARAGLDVLMVEKVARNQVEQWKTAHAASSDARALLVRYSPSGERLRSWADVAESVNESAIDHWPVKGPRTAQRVARFMSRRNTGPEDHHRWWRSTARLNASDWGVAEHGQLCSYLEAAGSVDQLDLSNLVVMEKIARRLQTIEYQYAEKVREGERGGTAGASSAVAGSAVTANDEMDLFEGRERVNPTVCCAPTLIEHASKELEKESQIQKQARKARREEVQEWMSEHALPNSVGMRSFEVSKMKIYHDPGLRKSMRRYARVLQMLHDRDMVEFVCEEGDTCVGLFTVRKKSGAQRLIADCRQSNCFFTSSDHVELPTSGALSRLRLEAKWMKQLLPDILSTGGIVRPRLTVMPMGWVHALYWSMSSELGEICWGSVSRETVGSCHGMNGIQIGGISWAEVVLILGLCWKKGMMMALGHLKVPCEECLLFLGFTLACFMLSGMRILACRDGAWSLPQRQSMCVGEFGDGRRSYLRRLAGLARRSGMVIAQNVTGVELDRAQDRIIRFLGQMSAVSLDAAVAEHLNEEFFEGATGGEGGRLLAALSWAFASVGKQACNLPRARTCSAALRRLALGESRLPVPESLLFVVANELIAQGKLQQGVAVLAAHHCYLRPGELSRTTWGMIHPPVSASGPGATVTIVLHPFELGVSSKVGEFDETVGWTGHLLLRRSFGFDGRRTIAEIKHSEEIIRRQVFGGCAEDPAECGRAAAGSSGPARTLIVPFFLEIFAGAARVSREMSWLGFLAIAIDTRFDVRHDKKCLQGIGSPAPSRALTAPEGLCKCDAGGSMKGAIEDIEAETEISKEDILDVINFARLEKCYDHDKTKLVIGALGAPMWEGQILISRALEAEGQAVHRRDVGPVGWLEEEAVIVKNAVSPVDIVVSTPLDLLTLPRNVVHPGLAMLRQAFLLQLVSILCLQLANVVHPVTLGKRQLPPLTSSLSSRRPGELAEATKKDLINYISERLPATVTSDQRICEISDEMDSVRKRGEAMELRLQVARTSEWARKVDRSVFIIRGKEDMAKDLVQQALAPWLDAANYQMGEEVHADGEALDSLLRRFRHSHHICSAPPERDRLGGAATIVPTGPDLTITPDVVVPGRILLTEIVHIPSNFVLYHWNVHNHDISNNEFGPFARKFRAQVRASQANPANSVVFLVGDFNIADSTGERAPSGTPDGSGADAAPRQDRAGDRRWRQLWKKLVEFDAERPTHWHQPTQQAIQIDRAFTSAPAWLVMRFWQSVTVAAEPQELHRDEISDHAPLILQWAPRPPGDQDRVRPLPRHIVQDPMFSKMVVEYEQLAGIDRPWLSAPSRLRLAIKCRRGAARATRDLQLRARRLGAPQFAMIFRTIALAIMRQDAGAARAARARHEWTREYVAVDVDDLGGAFTVRNVDPVRFQGAFRDAQHTSQEALELRRAALVTAWACFARKLRRAAQARQAADEARAAAPAQREAAAPAAERWAAEVRTIGKPDHFDGTEWRDWSVGFGAHAGATNPRMAEALQRPARAAAPMLNATLEDDDVEISRQLHYWLVQTCRAQVRTRYAGLLMQLLSWDFSGELITRMEAFEREISVYEGQTGEQLSNAIKIGIVLQRLPDSPPKQHMIMNAERIEQRVQFRERNKPGHIAKHCKQREVPAVEAGREPEPEKAIRGLFLNALNKGSAAQEACDLLQDNGIASEELYGKLLELGAVARGPRKLAMVVDSSAATTVMTMESFADYPLVDNEMSRRGEGYRAADGGWVPDCCTRELAGEITAAGGARVFEGIKARVAHVTKRLASVSEMVDAGHAIVFGRERSFARNESTGQEINFVRRNSVHEMDVYPRAKAREVLGQRRPWEPTEQQKMDHEVSRVPFRARRRRCAAGRGRAAPRKPCDRAEDGAPIVALDYAYLGGSQDGENGSSPTPAARDSAIRWISSEVLPSKGLTHPFNVETLARLCAQMDHAKMHLKSDQEKPIVSLKAAAAARLKENGATAMTEESAAGESQSNGESRLVGKWLEGILFGVVEGTDEVCIGAPKGVFRARGARRLLGPSWSDKVLLAEMRGVPWDPVPGGIEGSRAPDGGGGLAAPPAHVKIVADHAGAPRRVYLRRDVELQRHGYTEGCYGCTSAALGRRAQARSEECPKRIEEAMASDMDLSQRVEGARARRALPSAEDRAAPEVGQLTIADARQIGTLLMQLGAFEGDIAEVFNPGEVCRLAPCFDLKPGIARHGPADWLGLPRQEPARAGDAGDHGEQAHVRGGEPRVHAILADPEDGEKVRDQERYQALLKRCVVYLELVLVICALQQREGRFFLYEHPWTAWSWHLKIVEKVRLLEGRSADLRDHAAARGAAAAALHGHVVQRLGVQDPLDISRAHLHSELLRRVYLKAPAEDEKCGEDERWLLLKAMHGLRDAGAAFDLKVEKVMEELGARQRQFSLCVYRMGSLVARRHGDDFVVFGGRSEARDFEAGLGKRLIVQCRGILGPEASEGDVKEIVVLNRILRWAGPRHVEIALARLGLDGKSKPVSAPGVEKDTPGGEGLKGREREMYRSARMRLAYLPPDRPDLQFSSMEAARAVQAPTLGGREALKRVGRYLLGAPRLLATCARQSPPKKLNIFTDSDFAGCTRTRKSTWAMSALRGSHWIKSSSTTQQVQSVSTGGAEFHALVKGASAGLSFRALLGDNGYGNVDVELCCDATAGKVVKIRKVPGASDGADLGTKHVEATLIARSLASLGFVKMTGSSSVSDASDYLYEYSPDVGDVKGLYKFNPASVSDASIYQYEFDASDVSNNNSIYKLNSASVRDASFYLYEFPDVSDVNNCIYKSNFANASVSDASFILGVSDVDPSFYKFNYASVSNELEAFSAELEASNVEISELLDGDDSAKVEAAAADLAAIPEAAAKELKYDNMSIKEKKLMDEAMKVEWSKWTEFGAYKKLPPKRHIKGSFPAEGAPHLGSDGRCGPFDWPHLQQAAQTGTGAMGMCAVTFCCPPACAGLTCVSGVLTCAKPTIVLHKVWLIGSSLLLLLGLGIYLHLTFACRDLTATSLGFEPENQTGVWVNATAQLPWTAAKLWLPRMCDFPTTGICDDFVDEEGARAQEQFVLINFTERDLGIRERLPWSPSPLAYQGFGCWSEGSGDFFFNGILAAFAMAAGASALLMSSVVFGLKRTGNSCCGRPLEEKPLEDV
ncbi:unnamed protein product [Prorocentrum cordatum]|uniref:Uncharacterized protein n=1 Tax=Prorocentrum cordatum TaxID=2364126 RepID=A0ABN9T043_9DINO|nr:unnamed protein product [Polarella glacialis]